MLGDDGDAMAAVHALARAEEAVDDAVRLLVDAEAADWTGPGATRYRRQLEEMTDRIRRGRAALQQATGAVAEHAAARWCGLGGPAGTGTGLLEPRWPAQPFGSPPRLAPPRATWPASSEVSP